MRLCFECHDNFHAAAAWTREELRAVKVADEKTHILDYEILDAGDIWETT